MNILETALRRIAVRKTEKAIISTASATGEFVSGKSGTQPKPKTWFGATIGNIIMYPLLMASVYFTMSIVGMIAYYNLGVLIISSIWLFVAMGSILQTKAPLYIEEPIYKSDRRYSTGRKIVGHKLVKSGNYYEISEKESKINKVDGFVKILIAAAWVVWFIIPSLKA